MTDAHHFDPMNSTFSVRNLPSGRQFEVLLPGTSLLALVALKDGGFSVSGPVHNYTPTHLLQDVNRIAAADPSSQHGRLEVSYDTSTPHFGDPSHSQQSYPHKLVYEYPLGPDRLESPGHRASSLMIEAGGVIYTYDGQPSPATIKVITEPKVVSAAAAIDVVLAAVNNDPAATVSGLGSYALQYLGSSVS